jgi:excisionase family DNA binding protein
MGKMSQSDVILKRLEGVSTKLAERGETDLAHEIDRVVSDLQRETSPERPSTLLTTGEAATLLGVRSVFTVKRWAREGILDGFRRGGRILVTRESVERILHTPKLAEERAVDADLAGMDAGDDSVPPTTWSGRKPWEAHAPAKS